MENQVIETTAEVTTVAAETTANSVATLLQSKGGKIAAVAVVAAVASYGIYKGAKFAIGKFKARKAAKAEQAAA